MSRRPVRWIEPRQRRRGRPRPRWAVAATIAAAGLLALGCTPRAHTVDGSTEADGMPDADTDLPEGTYDDAVMVHTIGGLRDIALGLYSVRDGAAHVHLMGPNEDYSARHVQGDHVVVERWDVQLLKVRENSVVFRVRELDERPDGPQADTVRVPGGARGYADVLVEVRQAVAADRFRVAVSTPEDSREGEASIGETVTILGYQVTLVERDGDDVHLEVVDPDGQPLPYPTDD